MKKQDAELPSTITVTQNTRSRGLCYKKKSEPESLVEQSIAATNSSQNILSVTLDSRSASTTNLSAVLNLHSTSCFKSNQSFVGEYVSNFQLVVMKFRRAIHQCTQAKLCQTIQVKFCRVIQAELRRNKVTPAIIRNGSFKVIDTLASEGEALCSEGAQPAPTISCSKLCGRGLIVDFIPTTLNPLLPPALNGAIAPTHQLNLHVESKPKLIVICFIIPLHFLEDCGIFCEEEYQIKDDGYAIVKQQSANIPDAGDKQHRSNISNDNAYDERQLKKKDGKAIINPEAVELTIGFGDLSLINFILIIGLLAGYLVDYPILVSFIGLDIIGFISLGLIGLIGISLIGINSLVGLLASFNR